MKRKIITIFTSLTLVAILLATLCACGSTWGSVKSAFKDEGYEIVDTTDEQKKQVADLVGEENANRADIHVVKKDFNIAIIVEFKSNDDIVNALRKSENITDEDIKAAYDKLQELPTVNGNCTIISLSPEALKIFKSTK